MGYDLSNRQGGRFRFSIHEWPLVLRLAEAWGWKPCGTIGADPAMFFTPEELPGPEEVQRLRDDWSGGYGTNSWQTVTAADADALADALELALPYVPAQESPAWQVSNYGGIPHRAMPNAALEDMPPAEYFGGSGRRHLREFIAFCRQGAFTIA